MKIFRSKPRQKFLCNGGFSLVELMVVVGIVSILSAVAIPAYTNYVRRAEQGDAVEALMRVKMEQEVFWADNNRYASTIGCLRSFGNNCAIAASTEGRYVITMTNGNTNTFTADAVRSLGGTNDRLKLSDATPRPIIQNPQALKWSLFDWLFN